MGHLPFYVGLLIELTVTLTIYLFYRATQSSKIFLVIAIGWAIIQALLGLSPAAKGTPVQLPMLVAPPMLLIIILFLSKKGRGFIDKLKLADLTLVHGVGLLVELVLYFLFVYKTVPQAMTFEGRNFDVFSGLTAPLIYYFGFVGKKLNRGILIAWNLICLMLLINASALAVLSLPNFGVIGKGQPDIALGVFPFTMLPAVIVPIVLLSHLASLRQLIMRKPLNAA